MSSNEIDWSKIDETRKKKLLDIAEMLHRYKGTKKLSGLISKELSVSGRDIALTRKLLDLGVIKIISGQAIWDEEEEFRQKTKQTQKALVDTSVAETAVTTAVQSHIAQRATLETELLLKAGEAYRRELTAYLIERGEKPENWSERNPDEILKEAFIALREVPRLREENNRLREIINIYEERLDPDIRLQKGIELLTNALLLDRIYELFGLDFLNSKTGKTYLRLIDTFIGGELIGK